MRLAVYCDYQYRRQGTHLSAQEPVALFLAELREHCERLTMVGRLDPAPGRYPYAIEGTEFVGLPHYPSGASPADLARSLPLTAMRFWRLLDQVDTIWVLGPTPLSLLLAILALARGRRLALGVRQDLPSLFRHRYPDRRLLRLGADMLELSFRLLSRVAPVAVVGPQLAHEYRGACRLHTMFVSLLSERDLAPPGSEDRDWKAPVLRMLSVGRLDPEKNPLLLAEIIAGAVRTDPRWHLDVCGDGPLADALAQRLAKLGVADRTTLRGHVPVDSGLLKLYLDSHAFIHVSHTEGVPQVLLEAFALRLPVVATAVGGVPGLVGDAGLLIEPDDAQAAVRALSRIGTDPGLRGRLVAGGLLQARLHSREAEIRRLAAFLAAEGPADGHGRAARWGRLGRRRRAART